MIKVLDIINLCNNLLNVDNYKDYSVNGLHVGNEKNNVKKIALGVSSSLNFIKQSSKWGADLCLCHHGIIFGKIGIINDILSNKLKILLNNISLAGYHLPLDFHEDLGNNIEICKVLNLKNCKKYKNGFVGDFENEIKWVDFIDLVKEKINNNICFYENKTEFIKKIFVSSGGASVFSNEAKEVGADTFLFGELKESSLHEIRERNLNFVAAGHYATEVFGIKKLGEFIKKTYPEIEIKFFEEDCRV
jgi:dinuclear metal center YbgI/SA1388 family protein